MKLTKQQAQVKLDIDNEGGQPLERGDRLSLDRIQLLLRRAGYRVVEHEVRRSPSGTGWHVVLTVRPRPKTPCEVVALQAICGSDPYREAMQMSRARWFGIMPRWTRDSWNVLYLPDDRRERHSRKLSRILIPPMKERKGVKHG